MKNKDFDARFRFSIVDQLTFVILASANMAAIAGISAIEPSAKIFCATIAAIYTFIFWYIGVMLSNRIGIKSPLIRIAFQILCIYAVVMFSGSFVYLFILFARR